ncbi:MAG: type VI secretion system baseplate subunit TssF [Blastocatellia bacterium]
MRDELLGYYERELTFLRQMGAEFAEKYPKIAGRLSLEPDKCEDPHVERMIEAFAFLTSRVQLKIDDEFPEVTESLLNVLYPHYLAPIPSMSIAQFGLDPQQGKLTTGYQIERGTTLYSRPVQGTACRFRTSYPVTLWPLEVTSAALESLDPVGARGKWSEAVVRISLRCLHNTKLSELKVTRGESEVGLEALRFYLNGEAQLVYPLYELLFNEQLHTLKVELRDNKTRKTITLPARAIKPVGFASDEGMLDYTPRSFVGYRLLTEYFAFPDKFLFFDVTGLEDAARAGFGDQMDILIYLKDVAPPRAKVDAGTFQLGCTPIINFFKKVAEPIQLTQQQHEYHVIPDIHRQTATEIYSIDAVTTVDPYLQQSRAFQPFYSYRHAYEREQQGSFWNATRRQSQRMDDEGTEVFLSLVDLNFSPKVPPVETITCHVTCTNRDLPARLPFGGREGDFEVENAGPLARVKCLRKPTETLRPPMRRGAHWRLISHLSLNHLSLVEGQRNGDPEALREILMLYDFLDSAATRKQILGLTHITSRRVVRQTGTRIGTGFVRGIETTITFDESQFVGSGVFLFASVLEKFLGLYASLNSFNQLIAKTEQREGEMKRWRPRVGEQVLL